MNCKQVSALTICCVIFFSANIYCNEEDDEGKRDYFEDNYEPGPYEILAPEFDQVNTYWPNELNESRFVQDGKVYIHSIEQDPPNVFWLHVYDARSQLYTESEIDIRLTTGVWDNSRNLIADSNQTMTVKITPGWNKVIVNMHHYKAQVISASLMGLRTKSRIKTIEFKDKM